MPERPRPSEPAGCVGRSRTVEDRIGASVVERMAATLGIAAPTHQLPPLWHWLFANPAIPQADLGPDGHERLGLFMPDIPEALRMWAASDVRFFAPVRIGNAVSVSSSITGVTPKQRPDECLWFVDVTHEWAAAGAPALVDRQTVVYRVGAGARTARPPMRHESDVGIPLVKAQFDDTALFRYSALTFNSHRIHLDRTFCRDETGDGRLVVHGPLLASIAAGAARDMLGADLTSFRFQARYPVREGEEISVMCLKHDRDGCALRIVGPDGGVRLEAQASATLPEA